MSLDAALIAGGRSRRFGSDKVFALWRGEPLWIYQIRKLLLIRGVNQVWLSTNPEQAFPDAMEGVVRVNDTISDIGPIGAFKSIFERSGADRIVLLAVDMPLLERTELETDRCLVPKIADRWEPLVGTYPRAGMLPLINQQIKAGEYSLQKLLDLAENAGLIEAKWVPDSQLNLYQNLNTLAEFPPFNRVQSTSVPC